MCMLASLFVDKILLPRYWSTNFNSSSKKKIRGKRRDYLCLILLNINIFIHFDNHNFEDVGLHHSSTFSILWSVSDDLLIKY